MQDFEKIKNKRIRNLIEDNTIAVVHELKVITEEDILNTIAIALAVFSFGVYQSMVPLYILIIACTYFLKCLKEKNSCWKFLGNRIVKFIIICLLYLIVSKIIGGENSYLQMGWTTYGLGSVKIIYKVMLSVLRSDTIAILSVKNLL